MIIRSGIPYGDEVRFRVLLSGALRAYTLPQISAKEREDWEKVPKEDREIAKSPRGLLFVCYQSSIDNGFYRQTTGFANNDYFPITSLAPDKIGLYNSLPREPALLTSASEQVRILSLADLSRRPRPQVRQR